MNALYHDVVPWERASRGKPCPICAKCDWCSVSADGALAICMRIADGAVKTTRNGGWLHRLHDTWDRPRQRVRAVPVPVQAPVRNDLAELVRRYQVSASIDPSRLDDLAKQLGLTVEVLQQLGIGWASRAELVATGTKCRSIGCWTFPMVDVHGRVRGIRLRTPEGFKFSLTGSHDGLFVPWWLAGGQDAMPIGAVLTTMFKTGPLMVCEGPTDTVAMLDLGLMAVGRSSCTGGTTLLVELVRVRKVDDVVIVADGDEPGQRGAKALASVLAAYLRRVRVIYPPAGIKDARAWKQAGVTTAEIQATINAAPVLSVRVAGRVVARG